MSDQLKKHPLFGILSEMLATQQGQRVASDYKAVQDAALAGSDYAAAAPDRIIERATDERGLDAGDAMSTASDLAMLLAGVGGAAKAGMATAKNWGPKWSSEIVKKIAPDSAAYTAKHADTAQSVLRKQLADPSQNMSHDSIRKAYLDAIQKRGLNAGPQGQQLDDMITGTLRRIDHRTNLENPASMEAAINAATGIRRNGVPKTLAVAGMGGAGAASMDQPQDPQSAQIAEIIRRIQAGEM